MKLELKTPHMCAFCQSTDATGAVRGTHLSEWGELVTELYGVCDACYAEIEADAARQGGDETDDDWDPSLCDCSANAKNHPCQ